MAHAQRLNVTLDAHRVTKLMRLAARARVSEGRLASFLLSRALDEADVDARVVVAVLDRIPEAFERAREGLRQARSRKTIDLSDL